MIFLIVALTFSSILLLLLGRSKSSFWFIGMLVGIGMLIVGFIFYLSKIGGIQQELEVLFFLTADLRKKFLYAPIGTNNLSSFTNIGRVLALFCYTGFCISESTLISYRNKRWFYLGTGITTTLFFVVFSPQVYVHLSGQLSPIQLRNLDLFWRSLMVLILIAASVLLLHSVYRIRLHWMRKRMAVVCVSTLELALVFVVMGVFTPLQISQMDRIYFFLSRFFYYRGGNSLRFWQIIIVAAVLMTIISAFFLVDYIRIERELGHSNGRFDKKIYRSDLGVRVFSHGIKNQLLVNQVLIQELLETLPDSGEAAGLAEKLAENHESILQRINQLNDFFREKKFVFKPLKMSELLIPLQKKYAHASYENKVSFQSLPDDIVLVDQGLMQQTLINIINNALEAIRGRIDGEVKILAYSDAHQIIIQIQDNGVGILPENLNRIFEPFFTSKNTRNNWGIGLAYARRILKEHSGYIRTESAEGLGTSFYLVLPRYNRGIKTHENRQ